VVVLMSAAATKLPWYVFPALPALAYLCAEVWEAQQDHPKPSTTWQLLGLYKIRINHHTISCCWSNPVPKRLQIAPHLPLAELERRYRQASEGIERSHYQIIWLLAQGRKSEEVAALTSYSRLWIYELVRSYNRCGPEALGDKRRENPGQSPLLNDVQQAQLWQALQDSPTDGDLWDGPKVAQWMSAVLGRKVHPQRGWEYLKSLEMRRRRPRPAHIESDETAQREWKKTSPDGGDVAPHLPRCPSERLGRR
jgi:transposase